MLCQRRHVDYNKVVGRARAFVSMYTTNGSSARFTFRWHTARAHHSRARRTHVRALNLLHCASAIVELAQRLCRPLQASTRWHSREQADARACGCGRHRQQETRRRRRHRRVQRRRRRWCASRRRAGTATTSTSPLARRSLRCAPPHSPLYPLNRAPSLAVWGVVVSSTRAAGSRRSAFAGGCHCPPR